MVKKVKQKKKRGNAALKEYVLKDIEQERRKRGLSESRMYKFGFWLFFLLVLFSVGFGIWAVSSIYSNFNLITDILDESFERTNIVLDVTSSKMMSCEQQVKECQQSLGRAGSEVPPG